MFKNNLWHFLSLDNCKVEQEINTHIHIYRRNNKQGWVDETYAIYTTFILQGVYPFIHGVKHFFHSLTLCMQWVYSISKDVFLLGTKDPKKKGTG